MTFPDLIMIPRGNVKDPLTPVTAVIVVLVICGCVFWLFYSSYNRDKYFSKGIFPPNFKYNRDNLMEAYISAAALMVRKDRGQMVSKLGYINAYFQRYFKDVYYDFKSSYMESLSTPVSVKSLAVWVNKHQNEEEKWRLVKFLVDLAFYDGSLNQSESNALHTLVAALNLDVAQLNVFIGEHVERESRQRTADRPSAASGTAGSAIRKKHAEKLGLADPFTVEEVKKAYRRLAMVYHPDKYQKDSEEVKEKAHAKFLEIQEAYEYLGS